MREILFRGKHIDGYGWETGDLIHNGDDRFTMTFIGGIAVNHDTHTDEISFDGHWLAEVDPATVFENHSQDTRYTGPLDTAPTVSAAYGMGGNNQPFVVSEAMALENHPTDSRVKIAEDGKVQTITSRMGTGGGNVPLVMKIRAGCEDGGKGALVQSRRLQNEQYS